MPYQFIRQVGLEVEGGWDDAQGNNIIHDGSVNLKADYVGEIVSPPLYPYEVKAWYTKVHPPHANETCGLHIHVSFKKVGDYDKLMDLEFQDFLISELIAWGEKTNIRKDHPFWKRVKGENTYCSFNFWPERQWNKKEHHGERYTALNYTWARFKTIECRILPGFKDLEPALGAIFTVLDAFEKFLELKAAIKEPKEVFLVSEEEIKAEVENISSFVNLKIEKEDENFLVFCESVDLSAFEPSITISLT